MRGAPAFLFDEVTDYNLCMTAISPQELARDPDGVLNRVETGESIVVVRDGQPGAELRPISPERSTPRPFGRGAGEFVVPDDFDAPLPNISEICPAPEEPPDGKPA